MEFEIEIMNIKLSIGSGNLCNGGMAGVCIQYACNFRSKIENIMGTDILRCTGLEKLDQPPYIKSTRAMFLIVSVSGNVILLTQYV